ncbi:glutaredoxin domain-containing protein [Nocardia halotolerans]|uniref:Glutaredoxin domain-containing protein n=1 Tax=Nocardia halotolerans TaxID=1755878 RepID=A0ABV8VCN9_9NOCA
MYTQPDCQPCNATKRTLDKLGAEYTLIDITDNPDAYDTIRELGYQQTPVVVTNDLHWSGHRPDHLRRAANATNT